MLRNVLKSLTQKLAIAVILVCAAPVMAETNDKLIVALAHTFANPVPMDIWYMNQGESSFRWAKRVTIPANWTGWGELTFDMTDVPDFQNGAIRYIALNPIRPDMTSQNAFGFYTMRIMTNSGKAWGSWGISVPTGINLNVPSLSWSQTSFQATQYWALNMGPFWTDTARDVIVGSLGSSSSFQWAVTPEAPLIGQEHSNWCWVATGQMIMRYWGVNVSQCTQVNDNDNRSDCCDNPFPESCNHGGNPNYSRYGFANTWSSNGSYTMSWNAVKAQFLYSTPRPFAWIHSWSGGGAHWQVVSSAASYGGQNYVVVDDPWPVNAGDRYLITYETFANGYPSSAEIYDIHL